MSLPDMKKKQSVSQFLLVFSFSLCISQQILKLSLTVEKNLFGAEAAAGWEEEHRQGFAAYKRKFCWVQTDAVLEDEEWKLFFMSL
jgi:hypothetical protein